MKTTDETLKLLRALGVKRARFEGEDLLSVEFFSGEPPTADPADGLTGETIPADASLAATEDYEAALAQLRQRRFEKKGAD